MKKSLLALAALTAFVGVASAQSSVTLFGIVDLEARQVRNPGGSIKSLSSDGYNSSRLGVRGIEDIGGGMRAGFWLEGGLAADVGSQGGSNTAAAGAPAALWNRRATVSLMGGFGEVRLGRDYTPSFWNHTVFDVFGTNGIGSGLNVSATGGQGQILGAPTNTFVRANNSIGYFLPAMGGLYGQVMFAAGEGATATANKYTGVRVGYAAGPVNFAVAMGSTKRDGVTGMVADAKDTNIGGSFNAGFATLYLKYSKLTYNLESQKLLGLGIGMPLGSGTLRASFNKASGSTSSLTATNQYDAKQIAIGYVYDLTKRTALYGTYSSINNGGSATAGATFAVGVPSVAMTRSGAAANAGGSSNGIEFGVRHAF